MNDNLILTIIEKFSSGAIGELDLDDGTTHLILRNVAETPSAPQPDAARSAAPLPAAPQEKVEAQNESAAENTTAITSPIVATYYSSPTPDSPAFVKPGSKVKAGQTLCILEAMKMMNHLEAEFDCEIIETYAVNGDMVEYGQTLFTVRRN